MQAIIGPRRARLGLLALLCLLTACVAPPAQPSPTPVPALPPTPAEERPAPTAIASPTDAPVAAPATATPVAAPPPEPTPSAAATPTAHAEPSPAPSPAATALAVGPASPTPTAAPPARPNPAPAATSTPRPAQPTATPRAPTPRPAARRAFLGYYVPYDPTSWVSVTANADHLDYVAAQVATYDACGRIVSQDDRTLAAFARSRGIKLLASIFTSDDYVNHRLLTDEPTTAEALRQLADYAADDTYDGVDLDLEDVPAGDRAALTRFVARASDVVRGQGKLLTMAVPAKTRDATTGWAGAYDYAALAPHVDLMIIMSYAYTTSSTPPGSTAPYAWVDRVALYAAGQVPREKLLLGVAFYGYDWNTTLGGSARALRYPQAAALASRYGARPSLDPESRSATFGYVARAGETPPADTKLPPLSHEIRRRQPPPCPATPPPPTPRPTLPPRPTPTPPPLQSHVVWLEDAASVGARLEIARARGIGGVAAWRLGQEDPAAWQPLARWRAGG